jgi:hypothetical protein
MMKILLIFNFFCKNNFIRKWGSWFPDAGFKESDAHFWNQWSPSRGRIGGHHWNRDPHFWRSWFRKFSYGLTNFSTNFNFLGPAVAEKFLDEVGQFVMACFKGHSTVRAGDLGHFDKFFSFNLFSYLAVKCVLYWLGIIF